MISSNNHGGHKQKDAELLIKVNIAYDIQIYYTSQDKSCHTVVLELHWGFPAHTQDHENDKMDTQEDCRKDGK